MLPSRIRFMVRELPGPIKLGARSRGVVASLEVFVITPAVSMSPLNRDEGGRERL